MKQFILLFFLFILAVAESVVSIHLTLAGFLILLSFADLPLLVSWAFIIGLVLDLFSGNFIGINAALLIISILVFRFLKSFLYPALTYDTFPAQTLVTTSLGLVLISRFYGYFYNLISFGITTFDLNLRSAAWEVISCLILFPIIVFLSLRFGPKKQLELKF